MSEFRLIADQVRYDLCRFQVSEREHVIVDLILRLSFDMDRPAAKLPRLESFSACTNISKGNILGILQRLFDARIVTAERGTYRILPRSQTHEWLIQPRMNIEKAEEALQLLRALQVDEEQGELIPRDKSLTESIAEVAIEQARSVPESGTVFPNQEPPRSRIGNQGHPPNIRYTSDVPRTERKTSAARDVGTINAGALKARVRAFVGERDWQNYWEREEYSHLFTDDHCLKALDRSLRYVEAGAQDGIKVTKTRGAMLWFHFNKERERTMA